MDVGLHLLKRRPNGEPGKRRSRPRLVNADVLHPRHAVEAARVVGRRRVAAANRMHGAA